MGTKWVASLCGVALALGCGGSIDAVSEPVPERSDSEPSVRDGRPSASGADVPVERRQSNAWQFIVAHPRQTNGRTTLGLSGEDLSLLLDAAGVPHIAYASGDSSLGDEVRRAWLDGDAFQSDIVDEYGGRAQKSWIRGAPRPSVLLNNRGFAGLGYQATFAEDSGWTWRAFEGEEDDSAAGLSGVWHEGRARIAYVSALGNGVTSALRQGVAFDGEEPQPPQSTMETVQGYTALAVDASGTAHILYTAPALEIPKLSELMPAVVRYVTVLDGVWSEPETLSEPGNYAGLSLVVDDTGISHVSFTRSRLPADLLTQTSQVIYLTRRASYADWQRQLLPTESSAVASRESLAVAADGTVLLTYCALDSEEHRCNGLQLATLRDGTWSSEPIDEGCVDLGALATLQLAADGSVHVAYQGCERELMYAVRGGE
jgi:hypothetical protein